jgi:hypothetical protein
MPHTVLPVLLLTPQPSTDASLETFARGSGVEDQAYAPGTAVGGSAVVAILAAQCLAAECMNHGYKLDPLRDAILAMKES